MSQPLLRVVCSFALGVVLAGCRDPGFLVWAGLMGIGVCLALSIHRTRPFCIFLFLIGLGGLNLSIRNTLQDPNDLRRVAPEVPVLATLRGSLAAPPKLVQHSRRGESQEWTHVELRVAAVRFNNDPWRPASGRVAVSYPGTLPPTIHHRQEVEVDGVMSVPPGPRAPGLFSFADHLRNRGIYRQLRADNMSRWRLLSADPCSPPLGERFVRWARKTLSRGLPEDDPATGLIQAMTLGWKTALTDEVEAPFMASGTMHLFAISGLHIMLIAAILVAVLRFCRCPRAVCGAVALPLLWFYASATGWQPSAVRATLMTTIVLSGWSLQRPSNLLNSMSAAALLILAIDPRQLFQASFQFSFAVVLSLGLMFPPLRTWALGLVANDPMRPRELLPAWRIWMETPVHWLLLSCVTSFAAWVGSMPLTAHYFHLISPGTLFANVLMIPCASAALASALASLATGAWWGGVSEIFNNGAWFWMHCMMRISTAVADTPGSHYAVGSPGGGVLLVFYGTLLMVALRSFSDMRWRWWITPASLLVSLLLALQLLKAWKAAVITVIPAGGGTAVHLKPSGQFQPDLVDCGHARAFHAVLEPFLHAHGQSSIGSLTLTHGDSHQMGSGTNVLESFAPDLLGVGPIRFRSPTYRALVDEAQHRRVPITTLSRGDEFRGWTVLHPSNDFKSQRADDAPLVLRRNLMGTTVLLLSDLNRRGQRALLEGVRPSELQSTIVVVGVCTDRQPMVGELLEIIRPALLIVGDNEWPASRQASAEMLAQVSAYAEHVISTRAAGGIALEFRPGAWRAVDANGHTLATGGASSGGASTTPGHGAPPD